MESKTVRPKLDLVQIKTSKPFKNIHNAEAMCLGRYDYNHLYRILMKFSIASIPEDATILKAELKLYVADTGNKQSNVITPYVITEFWSEDTVTWNNQPSYSTSMHGDSINIKGIGQYAFDITHIIKKWYDDEVTNYGLILKNEEVANGTLAKILTASYKVCSPVITIKYILKCKHECKCKCECECKIIPTTFIENEQEMKINNFYQYSNVINSSLTKTSVYFVHNIGPYPIKAILQISPNGVLFLNDNGFEMEAGEFVAMGPHEFAKFVRLAVRTEQEFQESNVKIWYQAQE